MIFNFILLLVLVGGTQSQSASSGDIMETRVIVDKFVFNSWMSKLSTATTESQKIEETKKFLTNYTESLFHNVNYIYKGLQSSKINLQARIVSIEYFPNEHIVNENYAGSGSMLRETAMDSLKNWLANQTYPETDHTMLLTGLRIINRGGQTYLGLAYPSGMCQSSVSLSIVKFRLDGGMVDTMAHELGHSLSCDHDAGDCEAGYVMSNTSTDRSANDFMFSICSINSITNFLQTCHKGDCCLSAANTHTPERPSVSVGERYTPDLFCQLASGPQSYFCRSTYGEGRKDYSEMCIDLHCHRHRGYRCPRINSFDGFVCGRGKRCHLGQCVRSETAPTTVSDTCPEGDTEYAITREGQTCSQLFSSDFRGDCYFRPYSAACCEKCVSSRISGCEFGDKESWCASFIGSDLHKCSWRNNSIHCCESCRDYTP